MGGDVAELLDDVSGVRDGAGKDDGEAVGRVGLPRLDDVADEFRRVDAERQFARREIAAGSADALEIWRLDGFEDARLQERAFVDEFLWRRGDDEITEARGAEPGTVGAERRRG